MDDNPPSDCSELKLAELARREMDRAADILMDVRDDPYRQNAADLLRSVPTILQRVGVIVDMLQEGSMREELALRLTDLRDVLALLRRNEPDTPSNSFSA